MLLMPKSRKLEMLRKSLETETLKLGTPDAPFLYKMKKSETTLHEAIHLQNQPRRIRTSLCQCSSAKLVTSSKTGMRT